jgi:hypothetical protein
LKSSIETISRDFDIERDIAKIEKNEVESEFEAFFEKYKIGVVKWKKLARKRIRKLASQVVDFDAMTTELADERLKSSGLFQDLRDKCTHYQALFDRSTVNDGLLDHEHSRLYSDHNTLLRKLDSMTIKFKNELRCSSILGGKYLALAEELSALKKDVCDSSAKHRDL